MSQSLTVIKLGGALITDKGQPYTLRTEILDPIAAEIRRGLDEGLIERLILVHGVGSFGHPPVVQHRLHRGFQSPDQLIHLTFAQNSVLHLRLALAQACHRAGLAVATILPSSSMTANGFAAETHFWEPVRGFLDLGMIPLLGGDVLVDRQAGFSVHGGDGLAVDLAVHFGADRLIFATAVDGIYDRDPVQFPDATRFDRISLQTVNAQLDRHQRADASGAMAGKLDAARRAGNAIAAGLQVHVISMMQLGVLSSLLRGMMVGTEITL
jgi:isopentenyl phosphate kinase